MMSAKAAGKTGVVLLNMGGPESLADVRPFLTRLFLDRNLLQLPAQKHLGPLIARLRAPRVAGYYAKIGGRSPISHWCRRQAAGLAARLDNLSPHAAPHHAAVAFRYASPTADEAVRSLLDAGVTRAVALSMYPQYSCCVTGSSLKDLLSSVRAADPQGTIQWSVIDRWPTHPSFIKALKERVTSALERHFSRDENVPVIFSAHSVPMSLVHRGDPYVGEVAATAHAVMHGLPNPMYVAWQSKVGPKQWMGPCTRQLLSNMARAGAKSGLIVPVAFTSDHIETSYELDLDIIPQVRDLGMKNLHRSESLNDSSLFLDALAHIASAHLSKKTKLPQRTSTNCAGCVNPTCKDVLKYFNNQHELISCMDAKTDARRSTLEATTITN